MKTRNYSRKRQAVLDRICSTTCHPTADWVFQEVRKDYPDISLGTVYRNLGLFKEDGTIISVGTVNGQERFDGLTEPHGHFVCQQCSDVIDIPSSVDLPELVDNLKEAKIAKIDRMDVTIYGHCQSCLEV
jgi:Fur family peroxide stress response transcriptional regulator